MTIACALLAIACMVLLPLCIFLAVRCVQWRERYMELLDKPFEFWRAREAGRQAKARLAGFITMDEDSAA